LYTINVIIIIITVDPIVYKICGPRLLYSERRIIYYIAVII